VIAAIDRRMARRLVKPAAIGGGLAG